MTWKILHDMNVSRLRVNGIINADTARLSLNRLKQGDADVEVYMAAWKRLHDDAHGGADPMLRKSKCIDGLNRTIREDHRITTPHVVPFHPRVIARDRKDHFAGMDFPTLSDELEREEADMREEMSITAADKYAPYEAGQVESDS